ncbi:ABC transporter permease [Dethiobacter alkaliphilus]|uniref:ABC transporter permease n=1 Tax=Dethiobacter alkaliphilus TaxID=427926 RepID=UPI002227953E|nr:ABC transporter permease [Dethiobacter alkaliphilus]MCW3489190.1 ABC transporter permease [Dethiobacter alkaliphilus]
MADALRQAFLMLISFDSELYQIISLTLYVSGSAVMVAALIGVPAGTWLGMQPPRKVRWLTVFIYTLMGLPPVVGGLVVVMILSRRGMLGFLGLLYTPTAMIIAQVLLAVPIIIGLTSVAVRSKGKEMQETLLSLGAERRLIMWTIMREARYGILGALIAGFGRVIAEVGAVMMVGGNIAGRTRVMTTAIVMEVGMGNMAFAMALGLILLLLAFAIYSVLYRIQSGGTDE